MIEVKKISLRTVPECRYYNGIVLRDICSFKGWTRDEADQWVKSTWNIESIGALNTIEFEALMSCIREHCSEYWGLEILPPKNGLKISIKKL